MIALILIVVVMTSMARAATVKTDLCPENQRLVTCGFCDAKTCDDLGYPVACPQIIGPCYNQCVCIENYYKNSQDVCIPEESCPSCGGDRNATRGDGLHCGNLCSNYFEPQSKFDDCRKQYPEFNGCRCKKGFVFNDVTRQCVSPEDCPKL